MLAGLLEPTSGEIRINELAARHYWHEIQWRIGYMPDFFGVYDDLLVWEYLDFFARCYKLSPTRRRQMTDELLELVDLGHKRNEYVHTLSRGIGHRLCLAHALVHDPQVLLLDEPASGLDPRARVEMRELLRELRAMGKTIVLSSHILSELAELCDTIGILEKGRLVASGTLHEIRQWVHPRRVLRIKTLSDPGEAQALLEASPDVAQVIPTDGDPGTFDVEITADEDAAADLLKTLINQRVRVTSFSELSAGLEEIYLQLTTGEVS
jgi:ABC-2 type transport system ATP-binding protein